MAKRITKKVLSAINELSQGKTKPYDTAATILRVEGNTAYVHIPGGVEETPVQLTIDAKPGDSVRVRVSNNQAWLTGNGTAPPTDDTVAHASAKTATDYVTDTNDGIFVHRNNDNQNGVRIRNNVDIVRNGKSVANYGENARIGRTDGARMIVSPNSIQGINDYGAKFFAVDMDGAQQTIGYYKTISAVIGVSENASMTINDSPDFDFISSGAEIAVGITLLGGGFLDIADWDVTKGTAETTTITSVAGTVFTLVYDGKHSFTISWNNTIQRSGRLDIIEKPTMNTPSLTFGMRDGESGAFSVVMGQRLTAQYQHQVVLGAYNDNKIYNLFEIGNGMEGYPRNVFAVDEVGNVECNNLPAMVECGQVVTDNVASHSYADYTVSFDKNFTSAPKVVVGMMSASTGYGCGSVSVSAHSITKTGFTVRIFNNDSTARSPYVHWIAMQSETLIHT